MGNHLLGDKLRQEHIALGVDAHHIVEAFLAHIQKVGADLGCDAGVVDQHVHPPKGSQRGVQNFFAVIGAADVRLHIGAINAKGLQRIQCGLVFFLRAGGDHHNVVSVQPQLPGNGKADTAAGAGDDGSFFHTHLLLISRGSWRAVFF